MSRESRCTHAARVLRSPPHLTLRHPSSTSLLGAVGAIGCPVPTPIHPLDVPCLPLNKVAWQRHARNTKAGERRELEAKRDRAWVKKSE
ncbi:hypothetical protein ASPZODRAFT_1712825 [Penicilliopsis zonata CBS 506.65]|uniref:Uncharacterized protein n=1 Tax=Penicilliopsis zonata CBS 506.65 TaxID=1073090 RepID=A0A1L9SKC5_9EURO|nr:hypothetical protein ASPZODRAFT_1712825 [Penicilliopsis zonata CBS 506.65]OJJ47546.1 hypothetical protein ASPZODRAFT_1712825 [Penicilliopsis zonata CBS 506.65]